ncbi:MAG TPA: hypothetical protein VH458_07365 [Vicinamibacterales bacterium]|jgi:hypothetical protein
MIALCLVLLLGQMTFDAPAGWHARPAASSMRVAEFVVPRVADDREDAEVIVYYFGGQGGRADANITRWIGQMQQPDGRPSAEVAKRETRTVNGLNASIVEVAGTFVAEVRPGASEHFNKPAYRMRAAVVETPAGPYFVKLTGPDKTVTAAVHAFDQFLESMHVQK